MNRDVQLEYRGWKLKLSPGWIEAVAEAIVVAWTLLVECRRRARQAEEEEKKTQQDDPPEPSAPNEEPLPPRPAGDTGVCHICYDGPCNACLVPCGHTLCYGRCARNVSRCPFCRRNVERVIKLYF